PIHVRDTSYDASSGYSLLSYFFPRVPRPPSSTLFPYTTLFRSCFDSRLASSAIWSGSGTMPVTEMTSSGEVPQVTIGGSLAASRDRKSTRLNSSHRTISYAVFCLKKKNYGHAHSMRRCTSLFLS